MKFALIFAAAAALFTSALAQTSVTVAYDQTYDNADASLDTVACSDGVNGLESKGYTTFGSLPDFPNIGAAAAVTGWDSAACGTCWELEYNGATVYVLAIDHAGSGFNIALAAMNDLTDGQGTFVGRITATATQVDASQCGL